MSDISSAKNLLKEGKYTCVLCKEDKVYTSMLRGVAPMLGFINSGTDLKGFSAADKVVGKAVALLFIFAGLKEVYAEIISEAALKTLSNSGIQVSYNTVVNKIMNHAGTDSCPMEQVVEYIDDPQEAFEKVKIKLAAMQKKS